MRISIDDIYTSFGKILNNQDFINVYAPNFQNVLWYAGNESENRGDINRNDETGHHGTVLIANMSDINSIVKTEKISCNKAKETICTTSRVLVTLNFYSNNDVSMDIMNNIKRLFDLTPVKDKLGELGTQIIKIGSITRLDEIVQGRYEYRAGMDITIETVTNSLSIELDTFNDIETFTSDCNGGFKNKISNLKRECEK